MSRPRTAPLCHVRVPYLPEQFCAEAPHARLQIRFPERPLLVGLDEGHAGVAIAVARPAPPKIQVTPLFNDPWVPLFVPNSPQGVSDASELRRPLRHSGRDGAPERRVTNSGGRECVSAVDRPET